MDTPPDSMWFSDREHAEGQDCGDRALPIGGARDVAQIIAPEDLLDRGGGSDLGHPGKSSRDEPQIHSDPAGMAKQDRASSGGSMRPVEDRLRRVDDYDAVGDSSATLSNDNIDIAYDLLYSGFLTCTGLYSGFLTFIIM